MRPTHLSIDGAYAIYLLAASEGAFIGTASVLVLTQTFSVFVLPGTVLGAAGGLLFARRYIRSNRG